MKFDISKKNSHEKHYQIEVIIGAYTNMALILHLYTCNAHTCLCMYTFLLKYITIPYYKRLYLLLLLHTPTKLFCSSNHFQYYMFKCFQHDGIIKKFH